METVKESKNYFSNSWISLYNQMSIPQNKKIPPPI